MFYYGVEAGCPSYCDMYTLYDKRKYQYNDITIPTYSSKVNLPLFVRNVVRDNLEYDNHRNNLRLIS